MKINVLNVSMIILELLVENARVKLAKVVFIMSQLSLLKIMIFCSRVPKILRPNFFF